MDAWAIKREDHINNHEQITLTNLIKGVYKLYIRGNVINPTTYVFNIDVRDHQLELITPKGKEKVERMAGGKKFRIKWVNNINDTNYNIKISIKRHFTPRRPNNCGYRERDDKWFEQARTSASEDHFDYDFEKEWEYIIGGSAYCVLFYDYQYKIKIELISRSTGYIYNADSTDFFSIINAPKNVDVSIINCSS